MRSARYEAYKAAMRLIAEHEDTLSANEAWQLRDCAEGLLLLRDADARLGHQILAMGRDRLQALVSSERWSILDAGELSGLLERCRGEIDEAPQERAGESAGVRPSG